MKNRLEKVVGRFEGGEGGVPNYYKKVEIKYSKFGVDDFDFGYDRTVSWLIIDFTILRHFRGWKHILPIRTRIPYCKSIILHPPSDYTPSLIQQQPVETLFAHYVNSASSSKI